jgi:hypothetical protein
MSTQETAALIESVNNMTGTVAGKMGQIDQKVATAQAQFDEWRQLKDVIGEPGDIGTMRMSIFQGHVYGTSAGIASGAGDFANKVPMLGTNSLVYFHFKTPLNVNVNSEMFWFNVRGYSYGSAKIIDEVFVGYCYSATRTVNSKACFGNLTPEVYVDTAGNVILRILMPDDYYTTVRVDTMRVGNGRLFKLDDLDVQLSLSATVEF